MTILLPIHNLKYNPTLTGLILSQAYIHVVIAPIHFGQEYLNLIMIIGDDPHCLLSNGFWGLSQVTQSMHSSDIETLTVITPRAEQLSNERLMGETYTCTLVCVLYMCMGVHVYIWDMLMYTSIRHACTCVCSRVWDVHVHLYMHWPCMCTCVGETNITCMQHVCTCTRI